jgi:hypothetical protein
MARKARSVPRRSRGRPPPKPQGWLGATSTGLRRRTRKRRVMQRWLRPDRPLPMIPVYGVTRSRGRVLAMSPFLLEGLHRKTRRQIGSLLQTGENLILRPRLDHLLAPWFRRRFCALKPRLIVAELRRLSRCICLILRITLLATRLDHLSNPNPRDYEPRFHLRLG